MTRQEPQARRRLCKKAILGKETGSAGTSTQSACKLQDSQSVFEQGRLSSPLRQPVCIVTVWGEARGGEQMTKCFRKTRKMTSLATPSVPRAGAHRNGLRDVGEARTSPLQPPKSRRLAAPICYILRNLLVHFAVSFGLAESFGIAVP